MKPDFIDYTHYRIARARETLDAVSVLLTTNHLHAAVNRLYYACFYAVSALLLTDDLRSSRHSGVRSIFTQRYVKTGVVSVEQGHFYQVLFERRQEGDYHDLVTFERGQVEQWYQDAISFVDEIIALAEKQLAARISSSGAGE